MKWTDYILICWVLSEIRWTGKGEEKVASGHTILRTSDTLHRQGTALLLTESTRKCLVDWRPYNQRMITARFRGKYTNISVIQIYAPTNDADSEEKELFYNQLQELIDKCPKHDIIVVMGDFNAKVGSDNKDREHFMEKKGVEK